MSKPQKKKVKYLFLKLAIGIVILAIIYVVVFSLIPVDQVENETMLDLVMGAHNTKQEFTDNFQFYILLLSLTSVFVVPVVLYVKKKKI